MKVVFYGARQAQWLNWVYRSLSGVGSNAAYVEIAPRPNPAQEEILREADLIAIEATGAPLPAAFDEIAGKAARAMFPTLALDFLWPFGGQPHLRNTRDATFPDGPFPVELGDAWLNRRLAGRQWPQAIEAEYLALDVAEIVDLDRYKDMALERQAELDRACGEDFASRMEARFRDEPLFSNPTTPGADLLRDLANRLFAKMHAPFALGSDWRSEANLPELPIHPSVARHFGLAWAEERRYRAWGGGQIDFAEYVRRYLAYAEGPELEAGIMLVADGKAHVALPMIEAALARPMGRRSESGRAALARAFVADPRSGEAGEALRSAGAADDADILEAAGLYLAGRWSEAEGAIAARLERGPASAGLYALLANLREKRGDHEGRALALRKAVSLAPGDMALQSRLTLALAAAGDLAGAIGSAEAEIRHRPDNAHARAFLSTLLERAGDLARARRELDAALKIVAEAPEYAGLRKALAQRQGALQKSG